jgi:hypothetical protein
MDPLFFAGRRKFSGLEIGEKHSWCHRDDCAWERGPQWLVFDQDVHESVYVKGRETNQVCSNQCPSPQQARARGYPGGENPYERECGAKPPLATMACSIGFVCPYSSLSLSLSCICQFSQCFCYVTRVIQERGQSRSNLSIAQLSAACIICSLASGVYVFAAAANIFVLITSGAVPQHAHCMCGARATPRKPATRSAPKGPN